MKISIFSSLGAWKDTHPKMAWILGLLLLAACLGGGFYGWKTYQYHQTGEYAFEQLKKALNPPDVHELAQLVDFNSISHELATAIQKTFPFYMAGNEQERNIVNLLQTALLKRFMAKEEKKGNYPDPDDENALLHHQLEILPPDFVTQLANGLSVRESGLNSELLGVKLDNPLLGRSFTVMLSMNRTPLGWKVNHVANANELLAQLREAMLKRHIKLRNIYLSKNRLTEKRMNQLLPIQSCNIDSGMLSDGKTLLMTLRVLARNKGNVQINNFNVSAVIRGKNGSVVAERNLNVAKPVGPGEDFDHRWNFELDANSQFGHTILRNEPLQCVATWNTLGLNSSEVLHIVEVPNPDRPCTIQGHDHPDGFCTLPVFQN